MLLPTQIVLMNDGSATGDPEAELLMILAVSLRKSDVVALYTLGIA